MHIVQQVLFLTVTALAVWLFSRKVGLIRKLILLGQPENLNDQPGRRWKNVLLLALGQQKMFRRPMVALLHLFVYAGFVIINIEVLEIVLDGVTGHHRLFAAPLGQFYTFLINAFEVLAVLVTAACIVFLLRRNLMKVPRVSGPELGGWPKSDANYILITEIILMSLFLTMNAADQALQLREYPGYHETGGFLFSGSLAGIFSGMGSTALVAIERTCWWLHIVGIFAFLNYLPYSKHLHILLAFPNAYYGRLTPPGEMANMPAVQNEVRYALQPELAPTAAESGPPRRFGAKDVSDLSWKNLLDAFSCTECGRCTSSCPANLTGKRLSPRKIMMATRDRLEEVGRNLQATGETKDDGKSLLHDYISTEELRACTTCNACVQECPVSISPLDIILQLRRYLVMEESNAPQEWSTMFSNVENNFAPWKFAPDERDRWTSETV